MDYFCFTNSFVNTSMYQVYYHLMPWTISVLQINLSILVCIKFGERTIAHWDKSPLGQKPTGQYPTGQKPTAKFGRVDKSPLFSKKKYF